MASALPAEPHRYTYADLSRWPAEERWELIEGIPYAMSPAPSANHQRISIALASQFHAFLKGKTCEAFPAPFDVRLPLPSEDDMTTTTSSAGSTVVCEPEKLDARGCIGAPTLVVEVLSPDTAARDWREKLHLYEQRGVPEYWIISPGEQTLLVFTRNEQAPVGVLPGLTIDLVEVFARVEI